MPQAKASTVLRNGRELARLAVLINRGSGTYKFEFHRLGKSVLRAVLKELGVEGRIKSNLAGDGITGDVSLRTDRVYVCLSGFSVDTPPRFMFRAAKSQKDTVGGHNQWFHYYRLGEADGLAEFVGKLRDLTDRPTT